MAIISDGDTVTVFKFKETGLVALCLEIAHYVHTKEPAFRNLDLDSAEYFEDQNGHNIRFARK